MELVHDLLSGTTDLAAVVARRQDAGVLMQSFGLKVAATRHEVVELHGFVGSRLVNDGSFVSDVLDGNDGLNRLVIVNIALDDRLNDVVDMVGLRLVDDLSLVDDVSSLLAAVADLVLVDVETLESLSVAARVDVLLVNLSGSDDVLCGRVAAFLVDDGLDVMLNMVHVSIQVALAANLLGFVLVNRFLGNRSEVLVIVRSLRRVLVTEVSRLMTGLSASSLHHRIAASAGTSDSLVEVLSSSRRVVSPDDSRGSRVRGRRVSRRRVLIEDFLDFVHDESVRGDSRE